MDNDEFKGSMALAIACSLAEALEENGLIPASDFASRLRALADEDGASPLMSEGLNAFALAWERDEKRTLH